MPEFVTIGVYGWEEEAFFGALQRAGVDTLCDVRRRRGVRGATYAFANSQRLQARLAAAGIRYLHRLDMAPSVEVRQQQHTADLASHTSRRRRAALYPGFVEAYQRECLTEFDGRRFVAELGEQAKVVALFCVEREPAACHRGLVAQRLEEDLGVTVTHLLPARPAEG
jgi:uncharacterized protein (DUF488 family)